MKSDPSCLPLGWTVLKKNLFFSQLLRGVSHGSWKECYQTTTTTPSLKPQQSWCFIISKRLTGNPGGKEQLKILRCPPLVLAFRLQRREREKRDRGSWFRQLFSWRCLSEIIASFRGVLTSTDPPTISSLLRLQTFPACDWQQLSLVSIYTNSFALFLNSPPPTCPESSLFLLCPQLPIYSSPLSWLKQTDGGNKAREVLALFHPRIIIIVHATVQQRDMDSFARDVSFSPCDEWWLWSFQTFHRSIQAVIALLY